MYRDAAFQFCKFVSFSWVPFVCPCRGGGTIVRFGSQSFQPEYAPIRCRFVGDVGKGKRLREEADEYK